MSLAIVLVITSLGVLAREYTSLRWLVDREIRLREAVRWYPMTAWFVGFAVYTSLSLVPGTSGKSILFGWLFGFWPGVFMVDCALTVAAVSSFLCSRYLLRSFVESRYSLVLRQWRERVQGNAAFYLLMVRFMHAPFTAVNYGAGALNIVPLPTFWWTTQLGLLPGTMVFVFAGTRIPTLAELAEQGVLELLDGSLITALSATVILPVVVRIFIRLMQRRLSRGGQTKK